MSKGTWDKNTRFPRLYRREELKRRRKKHVLFALRNWVKILEKDVKTEE